MSSAAPTSSSSSSRTASDRGASRRKTPGFIENAMKRKSSFLQFFVMTGVLLMSMRSLSQKHHLHELSEENEDLRREQESLTLRRDSIKSALLREAASMDPSGLLSSQLHRLFGDS